MTYYYTLEQSGYDLFEVTLLTSETYYTQEDFTNLIQETINALLLRNEDIDDHTWQDGVTLALKTKGFTQVYPRDNVIRFKLNEFTFLDWLYHPKAVADTPAHYSLLSREIDSEEQKKHRIKWIAPEAAEIAERRIQNFYKQRRG